MNRRTFLKSGALAGTAWTLACSGGAGPSSTEGRADPAWVVSTWRSGLAANPVAAAILASGGSALDAAQRGVMVVEEDPSNMTVGLGGRPNRDGVVELDAAVMDGSSLDVGSVAGLQDFLHPVAVARRVMDETPHVMLVGDGARRFALDQGFEPTELLTDEARKDWEQHRSSQLTVDVDDHDTMGMITRDPNGRMAAAVTTSGMAFKLPGRVGDSPIAGAGLYVDDQAGGAVATGLGEEVIKVCGCYQIVEFMRQGLAPDEAIRRLIDRIVGRDAGLQDELLAFVAVRADGAVGLGSTIDGFQAVVSRGSELHELVDVERHVRTATRQ